MKKPLLLLLSAGFISLLPAQNNLPVITNLTLSVDTSTKEVMATFDLSDVENDSMEVFLKASDNAGNTYFINTVDVSGDVGFPVMQGTGKQVIWNYSAVNNPAVNYRIRIIADDHQTVSIQDMVDQVDTTRLINDMNIIEGVRHYTAGPAHLQEVRDTIFNRMGGLGLNPVLQNFVISAVPATNIVGKNAGLVNEGTVYIIDGHYDGVSTGPAADDNASAVIGVLEAARILSQYNFHNTLRFIGFDLEEAGLLGSAQYVNNNILPEENIAGVLNYEMIGYYSERNGSQTLPAGFNILFPAAYNAVVADTNKGNFITNVANVNSSPLKQKFDVCAALYVPALRVISVETPGTGTLTPDLRRSDHASFWDKNYQALMLTDGANFRNENYHTANDVSDSLNFEFISNVVKASIGTLAELAVPMHAGSATADIVLPNVVSSVQNIEMLAVKITPNPAHEKIMIQWETTTNTIEKITLTDASGKLVYQSSAIISGAQQHTILTDGLPAGMYFVSLTGKQFKKTEKVLIRH